MLNVSNLSVSFGGLVALDLDNYSVADKELRVIIGPNGAGKSTFMDLICGKTKADRGSIIYTGKEICGRKEVEIAKMGIGRKFQKPSVFTSLSVYDNMLLAIKSKKDIISSIFFKPSSEMTDRIMSVAKQVGLYKELQMTAGLLSHGQKQWLEIAIVMLQSPKLMLIDEPAAGMSDSETEKTGNLLTELAKEHAVIVIEHDMKFVEQIAQDNVSVLVQGQLLTEGTFAEVRNDQRVIDCYLGRSGSAQSRKRKRA